MAMSEMNSPGYEDCFVLVINGNVRDELTWLPGVFCSGCQWRCQRWTHLVMRIALFWSSMAMSEMNSPGYQECFVLVVNGDVRDELTWLWGVFCSGHQWQCQRWTHLATRSVLFWSSMAMSEMNSPGYQECFVLVVNGDVRDKLFRLAFLHYSFLLT